MESPAITSASRSTLLQQTTRTLFSDTPARTPSSELPNTMPRPQSQQKFTNGVQEDVRLSGPPTLRTDQEANVSISNLMDFSNTSLLVQDTVLSDDSSEVVLQKGDGQRDSDLLSLSQKYSRNSSDQFELSPELQLGRGDTDANRLSGPVHNLHTPSAPQDHKQDSRLRRTGGTPSSGLPLEDLEQTLLEITRTKTPQLPTRARQRIGHMGMTTLEEEDDLITSTERLSISPLMNTDYAKSPVNKDLESYGMSDRTARTDSTKSGKVFRSWTGSNVLSNLQGKDALGNTHDEQTKTRQISGGSQKSVTFSEHVDEKSFQSFGGLSAGNLEDLEEEYKRDDVDLDIIDVHSMQADMFDDLNAQSPEIRAKPAETERTASPLGETYLRRSPQSKLGEESSRSPLDSALHSGLDLSPDFASNPSPRLQLLEHISPTITPSKTPKLTTRKGVLSQGNLVSSSSMTGQSRSPFADQSSGYSDTPPVHLSHHTQDSLVEGLSNLKLSSPGYRAGMMNGRENMTHHTPKATLEFEGLFGK